MSKKVTKEEFLKRFNTIYPEACIEVLEYTAITNPCKIKCLKCGKEYSKSSANGFLNQFKCCGAHNETRYEKIVRLYEKLPDFQIIKKIDKDNVLIRHEKCGNEFKRSIQSCMGSPDSCKYCNTIKEKNMLPIEKVQKELDSRFFGNIQILDYNGQLEKNHYKCLKCGQIFTQTHTSLQYYSRGCPSCDRWKSRGEKIIANLLKENNINYKEQIGVEDLPKQHFDFAVYDENNNIKYFIEVQGEQHFEEREIFKDGLNKIQERDERKRKYCKENNIPLYEIIYRKGKFLNLDILPF